MSFNLLKGFWILLTIALIVYAVIITIQITKPTSCPPPNCPPPQPCGKPIPSDTPLIKNLENLISNGTQFAYSGNTQIGSIFKKPANAFMMLTFNTCNKCEYNNTIIYRGIVKICNCSNLMDAAVFTGNNQVVDYAGSCDVAYHIIYDTNKANPLLLFNYKFGGCSEQVASKLGSINDISYDIQDDEFIANINILATKGGLPEKDNVLINMKSGDSSNTFATDYSKNGKEHASGFCSSSPNGLKDPVAPLPSSCVTCKKDSA